MVELMITRANQIFPQCENYGSTAVIELEILRMVNSELNNQ